jgi:voltage-dependent potassium channel beta subunit
MAHRRVGSSGLKVSTIGLGSWLTYGTGGVDEETSARCIRAALDAGILFFDTADVYGAGAAERALGKALADCERSDLVIATKAYFPTSESPNNRGLSRKHLLESIEKSLKRLRTDYVDLYQCHRFDPQTPVDETVRAMGDLIRQGKTLYWGISCWDAAQIGEALRLADAMGYPRPISNQPPYNMLQREIEERVLPYCEREGIGQVVFSPLAEGLLTGKYAGGRIPERSRAASERFGQFLRPRMTERNHAIVARLADLAAEAGLTLPAMALAWALRLQGISSLITGASRPEQVAENARAGSVSLDDDLLRAIEMVLSGS